MVLIKVVFSLFHETSFWLSLVSKYNFSSLVIMFSCLTCFSNMVSIGFHLRIRFSSIWSLACIHFSSHQKKGGECFAPHSHGSERAPRCFAPNETWKIEKSTFSWNNEMIKESSRALSYGFNVDNIWLFLQFKSFHCVFPCVHPKMCQNLGALSLPWEWGAKHSPQITQRDPRAPRECQG